ncbi:zinc finger MYM-type protein 4-like isoform X3 [Girardinichthys multiradiatus]|uniref:zinc finger MYM-type protein 4-like isoform X3 n=1 Tax=Girardinichthys multiradiatus TaxID=208333 RepID=UPI001FAC3200|nr:zinc finger MYM-type protein 4-like isoform X3 [Girardinichthys multiradiatus]
MAEAGDGTEQQASYQVQVSGAEMQTTDRDSMEAIPEPGTTKDAGDPESVGESSPIKHEEEGNGAEEEENGAEDESQSKQAKNDELKTDESSSEAVSSQDGLKMVYIDDSEGEKEDTEEKPEEKEENTTKAKESSEETPEGPDISKDTQMDTTSDLKEVEKQTNYDMEDESRAEEDESWVEEDKSRAEKDESRVEEDESRVEEDESRVDESRAEKDKSRVEEDKSRVDESRAEKDKSRVEEDKSRVDESRAEKDKSRAEKDESRAEKDKSRVEEDESRAEKDESRAEEDESRAEEDESRAEEDESRAEKDESRAEEDESRAEEDESRAEEDESRVEEDESRVEEDESRVEEDESRAEKDESRAEKDESRAEKDESRAEKDESRAEKDESRAEEDESRAEEDESREDESRAEEDESREDESRAEEDESRAEEDESREDEKSSFATKLSVSAADDLDEMMDIGTVDQMEQEAQMKEEEEEEEENRSPTNTVSTLEDGNSAEEEEEADVKPSASDLMQSSSSPSSEAAGSTGRDSSSPATVVNGMKVVKLSITRLESQVRLTETEEMKSSPSPSLAKVKDEPVDEEYEQALISSTSTASVKDEPIKDDLKIGSVFSVTPSGETLPCVNPSSVHMSCSYCRKNLLKGQTAFQRKGSPALFCSTACLTTSFPSAKGATKLCNYCQKLMLQPQDIVLAPEANGIIKEFCSQSCLTSFNYKKHALSIRAAAVPPKATQTQSLCSMCSRFSTSKHEVILRGTVHKMCSDSCFNSFRTVNNLTMAGCANCGTYCQSKPVMLKLEDCSKTLCNMDCLAKYKEKTKVILPCLMCRAPHMLPQMFSNKNSDESVNMFCSNSCLMAFKVQSVSSSGARLNCDTCGKNTVPSYHLAMSDTSIRNFCSMPCVMTFQEKFKKNQTQLNVFTKLPVGSSQTQTATPTQLVDVPKLNCFQCSQAITSKPELIQIKDKIVFLCSSDCSMEYKKANAVMSLCEYCKIEKITREAKRINNKDCYFCSDGCKLLFRHELSKNWGKHCHSCIYCHCVSKKLVTAQYGGSVEEFCSEECRSKYTMLFCHVAKCDSCGRKGKLKQSLPLLGEVKHFCGISCLLKFCCDKVATQGEVLKATGEATPVIASVMSLADQPAGKSKSADKPAQQASKSKSKNSGNMGVQTDTLKSQPAPAPPPSAPKLLKNKALLCKPLVQNKGVSCKTQMVSVEAQTDDVLPKVMVLPVPVPVYVPVPMNMYSQFAPKPLSLPLPLPVPMFLPVTMDSAERIVETIQEIKQKIPSDPYEAELILMAEMVAEEDEEKNNKLETQKEKASGKETESKETPAPDDHISNYSDDLDTDDLANFLNNWEETSSEAGLRLPSRQNSSGRPNPILDVPVVPPPEPESEPLTPPGPPPMDIEADFSIDTLERMARLREHCNRSPSPTPVPRRRQAQRKARDKRGRKSQRVSKAAEESPPRTSSKKSVSAEILKLKSQYGIDAWKRWIRWRQTQPNMEQRRFGSRPLELKEDILRCTTAELSYGLCCFITEVKRPNGEPYSPDSLFYLCLGIQQYLFENGRVENIFMDRFYSKFSSDFTNMLKGFEPTITPRGYIHSRVEEEFLWGCKQLGAYSPIVLLNTLLFFCCKYFGFTTVEQHRQLSFAHVMRCTKTNPDNSKTTFLRFYPPIPVNEAESDPDGVPAKRRKEEESKEEILEMMENTENPLRCPVRLYEFYLSKCSESVKQRTNMFYLHPERCCVPNSPLWFSSTPLDDSTMESMLIRILTVRELHLRTKKDQQVVSDPPFIPEEEDEDSE